MILEGIKIITATEMRAVEKKSILEGASDEAYMQRAALGIANETMTVVSKLNCQKKISLLVGKGNNGGDGFATALYLLEKNFKIRAFSFFPLEECSSLSQKFGNEFIQRGGEILFPKEVAHLDFFLDGLILDGIFGTGFSGQPKDFIAEAIRYVNDSRIPVLAIDIPSGLNGDTGQTEGECIKAFETVYLGLPKSGFFFKKGYHFIGNLVAVDFGMERTYLDLAQAIAYLFNEKEVTKLLPPLLRTRHKYQKGYVLTIAGSKGMGGAAIMTAYASLRGGAGIVRLFYPEGMERDLDFAPYEIIKRPFSFQHLDEILEEEKRAKAYVIGPGLGRDESIHQFLKGLLEKISLPAVLDADALFFLSKYPQSKIPSGSILTPHYGEMLRLLQKEKGFDKEEELLKECQRFVEEKKCTLILKGAPSWIFYPDKLPLVIARGDPGMATAGSGDVLAGLLGGLLAEGLHSREAACLGVFLHDLAGEIAALEKTSYSIVATDLIEFLPKAFSSLQI